MVQSLQGSRRRPGKNVFLREKVENQGNFFSSLSKGIIIWCLDLQNLTELSSERQFTMYSYIDIFYLAEQTKFRDPLTGLAFEGNVNLRPNFALQEEISKWCKENGREFAPKKWPTPEEKEKLNAKSSDREISVLGKIWRVAKSCYTPAPQISAYTTNFVTSCWQTFRCVYRSMRNRFRAHTAWFMQPFPSLL